MKHLLYVSSRYVAKNKLQREAQDKIDNLNHTLHNDLVSLKKILSDLISELNEKHPRCTPIELHFTDYHGSLKNAVACHGVNSIHFSILKCQPYKKNSNAKN